MDEVVEIPVVMKGKCVRLRRAEHQEVATEPVHRQDIFGFPVATQHQVPTVPVR